jgi:hypothetical protein
MLPLVGALVVALAWPTATLADTCDQQRLHQALRDHDEISIEFRYKMRTGFIRRAKHADIAISRQRKGYLSASVSTTIDAVARHLQALDAHGQTFALVYEPKPNANGCAWLIGPDRGVSSAQVRWERNVAATIRNDLGVTVRAMTLVPTLLDSPNLIEGAKSAPPPAAPDTTKRLAEIGATLLPPALLATIETRVRRLLILPASDISTVPFAALPVSRPGAHLIDVATPIMLPGVDGLFFWVEAAPIKKGKVLIVGDPDLSDDKKWRFPPLPGARAEALAVSELLGTTALVGKDATATSVRKQLRGTDLSLLYFATHGIADGVDPMDASFLALAEDHLRAADIKHLSFPSRHPLVVMSACQSGMGKVFPGGVFGLARTWIYAGASQVLASQWNVDDGATAGMMQELMKRVASGASVEAAFHDATLKTREAHPDIARWGAFNLFGYPQPRR